MADRIIEIMQLGQHIEPIIVREYVSVRRAVDPRLKMRRRFFQCIVALTPGLLIGCVQVLPPEPAVLFTVPLSIDGKSVDAAIVDTGGEYDIILRQTYGLPVVGQAQVLVFNGPE